MSQQLTFAQLAAGDCRSLRGAEQRLEAATLAAALALLPGWENEGEHIAKSFTFASYEATLAFVNAVAGIAQAQDHHPDIVFGYDRCRVAWSTHSVGGISMNDLICAAKVEALQCP